jgi:hypothetical protein
VVLMSSVEFALDLISARASAAYGLRKLYNSWLDPAIRVRRSSDDAQIDIRFDRNGNLDLAALLTFVGSGNGFVTTWYDQSGNAQNATQATPANQPRIVSAGVIETENGKPTIVSNGNQWLVSGNAANWTRSTVSGTNSAVLFRRTGTTLGAAIGANVFAYLELASQNNGFRVNTRSTPTLDSNPTGNFTSLAVVTETATPTSLNLRVNGTSRASVSGPTMTPNTPTSGLVLFDRAPINNSGENFTGAISEAIIFKDTDVSVANAAILERNQGAYYGIKIL